VAAGGSPLAVAVSPDGKSAYVANQTGGPVGRVSQYSIHPRTGKLSPKSPATVAVGEVLEGVAVAPDADVSVKLGAPVSVKRGSWLTYTIVIANRGPSSAWRVALRDVLPYGTQFQSKSATSGHCTAPKTGTKGGTVTCKLGKLKRGNSPEVHIAVKVTANATQGAIINGATSQASRRTLRRNNKNHTHTKVKK
jgi:uncharacterized repeat protein (TIGR01451 family)